MKPRGQQCRNPYYFEVGTKDLSDKRFVIQASRDYSSQKHINNKPMELVIEKISLEQKESWNKFAPGWKKWDKLMMEFLKPKSDEIIRLLNPKESDLVLDVAAGTGEPGLTIANMVKKGKVVITDLAEEMLKVARENAEKRGIKNVEFRACDVSKLPFANNTFDVVSCRFGYMFFPEMYLATQEMYRVLKPGGRIAVSVWNVPEKNFWVTAISGPINRNLEIPVPPPEAPGMFRCSKSGLIMDLFRRAGFKNTLETEVRGRLNCGTVDTYWNMMTELAAPFVSALSSVDDFIRVKIKSEAFDLVKQRFPNGQFLVIDSSALVIYGEK